MPLPAILPPRLDLLLVVPCRCWISVLLHCAAAAARRGGLPVGDVLLTKYLRALGDLGGRREAAVCHRLYLFRLVFASEPPKIPPCIVGSVSITTATTAAVVEDVRTARSREQLAPSLPELERTAEREGLPSGPLIVTPSSSV